MVWWCHGVVGGVVGGVVDGVLVCVWEGGRLEGTEWQLLDRRTRTAIDPPR